MATVNAVFTEDVVEILNTAKAKLQAQRAEWEREIEETRQLFESREMMIDQTIVGMGGTSNGSSHGVSPKLSLAASNDDTARLSVSAEKREQVLACMGEVKTARQVDITKKVGLNSGTVSVALRLLEQEGLVTRSEIVDGSRIWNLVEASGEEVRATPAEEALAAA